MQKKGRLSIVMIAFLMGFILLSGCVDDTKVNEDNDLNEKTELIINGHVFGYALHDNIIIWTEEKGNQRSLYYKYTNQTTSYKFAGPISSGYTCSIFDKNIVWIEIKDDMIDLHLYDINSKNEIIIMDNIDRTALAFSPVIYKDNIVWPVKESYENHTETSSLYRYKISENKTDVLLKNISDWRGLEIENDKIVYIHNLYHDVSILNMTDHSTYTLEKHNITHISLSKDKLVFEQRIYDPPDGGMHVTCEGSHDEYLYLYNLNTKNYIILTDRDINTARPDIYDNYLVWMGNHSFESGLGGKVEQDWDIFLYDLSSNSEVQLTHTDEGEFGPQIYENHIIWIQLENGDATSKLMLYDF